MKLKINNRNQIIKKACLKAIYFAIIMIVFIMADTFSKDISTWEKNGLQFISISLMILLLIQMVKLRGFEYRSSAENLLIKNYSLYQQHYTSQKVYKIRKDRISKVNFQNQFQKKHLIIEYNHPTDGTVKYQFDISGCSKTEIQELTEDLQSILSSQKITSEYKPFLTNQIIA